MPWEEHLSADDTLAVDAVSSRSALTHTHFVALKVKDARRRPAARAHGRPADRVAGPAGRARERERAQGRRARSRSTSSGESLHRRGYREPGVQAAAPLKEIARRRDPAARGLARIAAAGGAARRPAVRLGHAADRGRAHGRRRRARACCASTSASSAGAGTTPRCGRRFSPRPRSGADAGLERLPVDRRLRRRRRARSAWRATTRRAPASATHVRFERRDLERLDPPADAAAGLVVTNPPYGLRLGDVADARRAVRSSSAGCCGSGSTAGKRRCSPRSEPDSRSSSACAASAGTTLYNGAVRDDASTPFDVTAEWYEGAGDARAARTHARRRDVREPAQEEPRAPRQVGAPRRA